MAKTKPNQKKPYTSKNDPDAPAVIADDVETPREGTASAEELPIVRSIGWHQTDKGFVVFVLKSQGDVILDKCILSEEGPESRLAAENRLKVTVVREFIMGGLDPSSGASA